MIEPGILGVLLAYLLGSIPFGLLLSKRAGAGDVRKIGSGNIGATNVLRTGKKGLAVATLLLDIGKGTVAVLITAYFNPDLAAMAGFAAFLGHVYPVWLNFKGGKGVATFVGVLFALGWMVGLATLIIWVLVAVIFKTSSLSSLTAAIAGPFLAYFLVSPQAAMWVFLMTFVIVLAHRENIKRILNGTEPKIGSSSQK
ncbi:MAG: glycerol-3-phosphate 1-O-acyltransferase PlsY [Alphaproteobacteria bacterium]